MSDSDAHDGASPDGHPLDVIFRPRGVAVVGVSTQPGPDGRMGGNFLNALLELGYDRDHALYAVNPKMSEVRGVPCYPSVLEIPDPLDHVISQIPAEGVPQLVEDCIRRGVRSLHFFTAGLSETGDEDLARQERELVGRARAAGMRLIGPNCMGLYAPGPGLAFNSESPKEHGNVFLLSQSGANATGIINGLGARGLRFSKGVSYGNAADLKSHDFFDYALHDPETELVVAYIEGPRDGRAFFEALKALARVKPTIVLKGGITEDGARAARSHTGSLAGSIDVFDAVCRQAGAMRVRTLDDLLDLAVAATTELRHTRGRNVTLVGAGGGYAVLSSDQMAMEGLTVPPLPDEVQDQAARVHPDRRDQRAQPGRRQLRARPPDGLPQRHRPHAPRLRPDRRLADDGPDLHHRRHALAPRPGPLARREAAAAGTDRRRARPRRAGAPRADRADPA